MIRRALLAFTAVLTALLATPATAQASAAGTVCTTDRITWTHSVYEWPGRFCLIAPLTSRPTSRLYFQGDQNLVGAFLVTHHAVFQSHTYGHAGPLVLALQDDGNLVIYTANSGRPLWQSHTYGHRGERFQLRVTWYGAAISTVWPDGSPKQTLRWLYLGD